MAVIISSNFYTITSHSYFHNHINNQTKFRISCRNPILSPPPPHHRRRLCACQASSKANNGDFHEAEEQRWLREEQRWLREEQRWLREEARWNTERQSLLRQISELSLQIQHLQSELDSLRENRSNSADFEVTLTKMAALLEAKSSIVEFSDTISNSESDVTSLDSIDEIPSVYSMEFEKEEKKEPLRNATSSLSSSSSLRMGAEGEEVRALQEALMNLGFYSGEEDMEFCSFSSGTERAVKTWQASIGIREDGMMTPELLEQLYSSQEIQSSKPKGEGNGVLTNVKEVQQTVVKKVPADAEVPENRVFLLGENRWEEPSRLNRGTDKSGSGVKAQSSAPKCLLCRGEGRLLCMECDGTGDPHIEEQFLDWVEEGAKCPYCEGLGYNICDLCEGKSVA